MRIEPSLRIMKYRDIALIICGVLCLFSTGSAKKGFILTSPKILDAGSTSYVTFTAFDVTSPKGTLHLTLRNWYTDEMIANTTVDVVGNLNMWVELLVPSSPADLRAKLRVSGTFGVAEKEVRVRRSSVLTFVQTDKPIYKPGQTVRFRVLPLDSQLRPLGPDTLADVWIEDPSNIRVSQWKQIKFTEGIVQLELPLSDEPPLGEWSIKTLVRQVAHAQKFHVEKYVLPKFDVKIKPPAFIMADADSIPLEICAWYSYGKKVDGTFKMKVTYKRYAWEDKRKSIPSVEQSGLISGCQTVHVNTQDVLLQTSEFGSRTLEFDAEVTENSTAITGNATANSGITHSPLKLEFLGSDGSSDHFKPGIPFYGELSAHKPNGDPAVNERVEICAEYQTGSSQLRRFERSYYLPQHRRPTDSHCHAFSTDRRGRVRFSVPPKSERCTRITLEARAVGHPSVPYREGLWAKKLDQPFASLVLHPWHTPSGHQVQIQPRFDQMECEVPLRVRIRYTASESAPVKFYHQVTSRGRIVEQGSHRRLFHPLPSLAEREKFDLGSADSFPFQMGEFRLRLEPRGPWGPAMRLLVFYVRDDGEIVADARKFAISHCLPNKVQLHFRHEQQSPGTEASLLLSAEPHSVCGIGLVDKSVEFLGRKNRFGKENIFKAVEKLDVGREAAPRQVTEDYCQQKEEDGGIFHQPSPHYYLSRKVSLHADTAMAFEEAGMAVVSSFEVETRPCEEAMLHGPYALFDDFMSKRGPPGSEANGLVNLRSRVVPETPTVTKVEAPPPEEEEETDQEIRSYFPETWLWEIHTVGSSGETALSPRLPDSVTRWVGGAVCVHPTRGLGVAEGAGVTAFRPFFVALRLPYSVVRGEGAPLLVTVFNYLEECLPIKLSLEPSPDFESESRFHSMCVCGGESKGHRFTVRPTALGLVNVTVYGFSMAEDGACGTGVTARLAARDAVTRQLRIEAEGFPKEEVFNYFVCPETTNGSYAAEVDLLLPEDVVEGSERAYVSVTGDLLGPSLHGGLGNLVRMPTGCGEQNMALLTPNVLVLDYLRATSRITPQLEQECINNMKTGYQRQLQYRHPDGSFSAFGPRDGGEGGSLWLTSFVVRTLGQARKHVQVDEQDLGLSTGWILSKQFENGCFQPTGFMLNKALKGGLDSGDDLYSLAPLTAYVVISLLESGARRPGQLPISNALSCMRAEPGPFAYALALFAYAAALAKENALAEKYLRQLEATAIVKGSQKYWSESGVGLSVAVETAGYFVLARMSQQGKGGSGGVLPVIRWLAQQRNANGGFISTQDTVVALQALSLYSSLQSGQSPLDMGLVVEGDDMVKGFRLEEASRLVTQTAAVPALPAVLDLQAVGDGCALVQFTLRYHVSRVPASEAFDLNVDARRLGSSSCNQPRIGICTRYRIPEQTSNMVVVSVKMASGFVPDEWSLFELQSDSNVQLMRHEVDENHVNLYFNELTNAEKCFQFFLKRELEVDDIQPATVKLYDYYQPEHEITKEYTIPSVCTTTSLPSLPTLPPLLSADDAEGTTRLQTFSSTTETTTTANFHQETIGTTRETDTVSEGDLIETAHGGLGTTLQEHAMTEPDASEVATAGTDTIETYSVTVVSDDVSLSSENPTFDATSTVSERFTVSETDESATESDTDGTTILDGIAQASEDLTSEADYPTSTNSDRLVSTDDSETEGETTAQASEELAAAESEETDLVDGSTAEMIAVETSSHATVSLDAFSKIELKDDAIDEDLGENALQMADDARIFQTHEQHLVNFVDREDDLDFPDGIEGNMPVTVLPPDEDIEHLLEDIPNIVGCPVCVAEFPENFTEIYCSSTRTLRILIRNAIRGSARILHDLSRHLPQSRPTKIFAKLEYDRRCRCPPLLQSGSIHLVMGPSALWDADSIRLTEGTIVVTSSYHTKAATRLKEARTECPAV